MTRVSKTAEESDKSLHGAVNNHSTPALQYADDEEDAKQALRAAAGERIRLIL